MHDLGFLVPIGIVSAVMARGAFTTWVRAKHGLPLVSRNADYDDVPGLQVIRV